LSKVLRPSPASQAVRCIYGVYSLSSRGALGRKAPLHFTGIMDVAVDFTGLAFLTEPID
jgi:hypothetical protein